MSGLNLNLPTLNLSKAKEVHNFNAISLKLKIIQNLSFTYVFNRMKMPLKYSSLKRFVAFVDMFKKYVINNMLLINVCLVFVLIIL